MSDIYCALCGEPWDAWGVHNGDMTLTEKRRFLRGQGCPCCDFGRKAGQATTEALLRAAGSEIEASDEDPITILLRRRLL